MPEATIIIPNYNGRKLLENCIKSLERQTVKDFKLLVIDNGSTDGSAGLGSDVLDMEVVPLAENMGFCKAVNLGLGMVETEYAILLNNDTEAGPRFVEELVRAIGQSGRIFSCSALMLDYTDRGIVDNAGDYYLALGWARARGKGKSAERFHGSRRIFSSCGGACIYRMSMLREIGFLDENHFAYLEDVDIGYRARICGYWNVYAPGAVVFHVGSATTGSRYNKKKVYLAARNSMYVVYKNMPPLQIALNSPFLLLGVLVKSLFFVKKGFGGEYVRGIRDGIGGRKSCERVPFALKNLGNYVEIQWELWLNCIRIFLC